MFFFHIFKINLNKKKVFFYLVTKTLFKKILIQCKPKKELQARSQTECFILKVSFFFLSNSRYASIPKHQCTPMFHRCASMLREVGMSRLCRINLPWG